MARRFFSTLVASEMLFAAAYLPIKFAKFSLSVLRHASKWDALEHCVFLVVLDRTRKSVQLKYQRAITLQKLQMTPWFIATEPFTPTDGQRWDKYVEWSGLKQLEELVSLDTLLCPTLLREIKEEYWPYIVHEDFMLHFFTEFDFLMKRVAPIERKNVLCVHRNPTAPADDSFGDFRFLGYDLVDDECSISALTNCGGFPEVFANSELSNLGLLTDFRRAVEVQRNLRLLHPEESHAVCNLWAILRLAPG